MENLIDEYMALFANTEVPPIYDRWCCIALISTILERNVYVDHGQSKIFPNNYILLVGDSGARKDTAIKRAVKLAEVSGYNFFAASKSSKEQFLIDLQEGLDNMDSVENDMDVNKGVLKPKKLSDETFKRLFPEFAEDMDLKPAQGWIIAKEWNSFFGMNNVEFYDLLTELWDWEGPYRKRLKNSTHIKISDPTINVLGGNTTIGIAQAFPIEIIGKGFFSRLFLVYSEATNIRITRLPRVNAELYEKVKQKLLAIRKFSGEIKINETVWGAIDEVYQGWKKLEDSRFESYSSRRIIHLLKICMVVAVGYGRMEILIEDVIYANSILYFTEHSMPRALGEFGKARNSDVSAKILEIIIRAGRPVDVQKDIWPQVQRDLEREEMLGDLIRNLITAGKIAATGGAGSSKLFPVKQIITFDHKYCDINLLKEWRDAQ